MGEVLDFNDVAKEHMGSLNPGRIKFSEGGVDFKNGKTGKVEHLTAADIDSCFWIRLGTKYGIKLMLENGDCHRFSGFKEEDQERFKSFLLSNWEKELESRMPCVKGYNYGDAEFNGTMLTFKVEDQDCFEIPLNNVSNAQTGKNEVTLEFHQNDEAAVSLCEVRFHIPPDGEDGHAVQHFYDRVIAKAGVIQAVGTAIATLSQVNFATPRGRYDIKVFPSFIQLHGSTYDYKIPISTVLRLFLLPHKDGRRMYFVISLDPPIKQGHTRYHFLILEFAKDEVVEIEPGISEEKLKEKFGDKLTKDNMTGRLFEVVSRILKTVINRKITVPGSFLGHSGTPSISCAHKNSSGFLYPLERGFIYVHKPPIHVRFEEITNVNFARSDVSMRSFDFEIETKTGASYSFSSIERDEYNRLYDFVSGKNLRIVNMGKEAKKVVMEDDFADSGSEEDHDPYKEKLKKEAKEREAGDDDSESDDSDFDPDVKRSSESSGSEPDEEYDSEAESSSESGGSEDGGGGGEDKPKKEKKEKKRKPSGSSEEEKPKAPKKAKKSTQDVNDVRKRRAKQAKDANAPKKNITSYMLWFQEVREQIKEPDMSLGDIAKKAGALWKTIEDKSEWETKAAEDKKRYEEEMEAYKQTDNYTKFLEKKAEQKKSGGGGESKKRAPSTKKSSAGGEGTPAKSALSREFVSSSADSDSDNAASSKKDEKEASGADPEQSDGAAAESD